jgi:hypothetical protein
MNQLSHYNSDYCREEYQKACNMNGLIGNMPKIVKSFMASLWLLSHHEWKNGLNTNG